MFWHSESLFYCSDTLNQCVPDRGLGVGHAVRSLSVQILVTIVFSRVTAYFTQNTLVGFVSSNGLRFDEIDEIDFLCTNGLMKWSEILCQIFFFCMVTWCLAERRYSSGDLNFRSLLLQERDQDISMATWITWTKGLVSWNPSEMCISEKQGIFHGGILQRRCSFQGNCWWCWQIRSLFRWWWPSMVHYRLRWWWMFLLSK